MEIIGKVVAMNTSDGMENLSVLDQEGEAYNLKTSLDSVFQIGHIYIFEVKKNLGERISYIVESYQAVMDLSLKESDAILRKFYPGASYSLEEAQKFIYEILDKIDNKIFCQI